MSRGDGKIKKNLDLFFYDMGCFQSECGFFYMGRSIFLESGGYEYLKINCVLPKSVSENCPNKRKDVFGTPYEIS